MLRLCEGVRSGGRVSVLREGLELSASYERDGLEQAGQSLHPQTSGNQSRGYEMLPAMRTMRSVYSVAAKSSETERLQEITICYLS